MSKKLKEQDILDALEVYDNKYRKNDADSGRSYVLVHKRKKYPPKSIVAIAKGVQNSELYGGKKGVNSELAKLGFTV
jgi:hypothetical protein